MTATPDAYYNYVAFADNKVVGFISGFIYQSFFHIDGTAIINELVVDEEYRGQDVGRSLVEH